MRTLACIVFGLALAACSAGASGGGGAASAEGAPAIAKVHASVCGNCHRRVEPGMRTRAELESALARHHRRVRLSQAEWRSMVDYLAMPPGGSSAEAKAAGSGR